MRRLCTLENMKYGITVLTLLMAAPLGLATSAAQTARGTTQEEGAERQAELQSELEKKLAKDFVGKGGWLLDYGKACTEAAEEKKLLFVYFTRTFAP